MLQRHHRQPWKCMHTKKVFASVWWHAGIAWLSACYRVCIFFKFILKYICICSFYLYLFVWSDWSFTGYGAAGNHSLSNLTGGKITVFFTMIRNTASIRKWLKPFLGLHFCTDVKYKCSLKWIHRDVVCESSDSWRCSVESLRHKPDGRWGHTLIIFALVLVSIVI